MENSVKSPIVDNSVNNNFNKSNIMENSVKPPYADKVYLEELKSVLKYLTSPYVRDGIAVKNYWKRLTIWKGVVPYQSENDWWDDVKHVVNEIKRIENLNN